MLADKISEPATSMWAANVVLGKKKDHSVRFCKDNANRQLNAKTRKYSHPLSRVDDCLELHSGSSWYVTLNPRSRYHRGRHRRFAHPFLRGGNVRRVTTVTRSDIQPVGDVQFHQPVQERNSSIEGMLAQMDEDTSVRQAEEDRIAELTR
jgi:hypothetical protein